jgi:NitT/TauT family transport system ATP-binding protein
MNLIPVDAGSTVLSARHLSKSFTTPDGGELRVLADVDVDLHVGEIVALLGRSGSGKSTLLRCLIGLTTPTSGEVRYRDRPVSGTMRGMAMVFQSFALFPWLSVQQNVELGLEPLGVGRSERRRRALDAIDIIGLDGFESALPKELSGGMRQRVGFARALVTSPDVLLMDEPFSALDVLTAENLRSELLDLWQARRIPTRAILLVTHNIEEAVLMADRILVLSAHPGRVTAEVVVPFARPRDRDAPDFRALVDRIYGIMTTRPRTVAEAVPTPVGIGPAGIGERLPYASLEALGGLVERVARGPDFGHEDLPLLAEEMQLEVNDLFPLVDAAALLGLARVEEGDITLLPPGNAFAAGDIQEQKRVFREQLLAHVSLVGHIRRVLETRPDHRAPGERFVRELEDYMNTEDSEAVLATAIEWGRYAELFAYDYNSGVLSLEPTDDAGAG